MVPPAWPKARAVGWLAPLHGRNAVPAAACPCALCSRGCAWLAYRRRLPARRARAHAAIDRAGRVLQLAARCCRSCLLALVASVASRCRPGVRGRAAALAGLRRRRDGRWFKFTLVTRAAFNQGFALAHLPVRGTRAVARHSGRVEAHGRDDRRREVGIPTRPGRATVLPPGGRDHAARAARGAAARPAARDGAQRLDHVPCIARGSMPPVSRPGDIRDARRRRSTCRSRSRPTCVTTIRSACSRGRSMHWCACTRRRARPASRPWSATRGTTSTPGPT